MAKKTKKNKSLSEYKVVATVIIKNASKMTLSQRREISAWLRRQASAIIREGQNYGTTLTARYMM